MAVEDGKLAAQSIHLKLTQRKLAEAQ